MDCGLRIADCGLRIADCGLWIVACGLQVAGWATAVSPHIPSVSRLRQGHVLLTNTGWRLLPAAQNGR
ncbi:MAG: hypothetical protein M5U34_47755 [Chloroflexi bacterium]|nr:hypothetical protein [Chloroflexota bacterium]